MQEYFQELKKYLIEKLKPQEEFSCYLSGEESDFCRFNHGKIRQPGIVKQNYLTLRLIKGKKQCEQQVGLSGLRNNDLEILQAALEKLRHSLMFIPDDPHFNIYTQAKQDISTTDDALPTREQFLDDILPVIDKHDFVGYLASGRNWYGLESSFNQSLWSSASSFNLDWSIYLNTDKAVKQNYAGLAWDKNAFESKVDSANDQIKILAKAPKTIQPGSYRAYLAPDALAEIISIVAYRGFGQRFVETKQTCLHKAYSGQDRFHKHVQIFENYESSLTPRFNNLGFPRSGKVSLIKDGLPDQLLVSPSSAQEYGSICTGSDAFEYPVSLEMAAGSLQQKDILTKLHTGLYISNLWYTNFSDLVAGRLTGMTRFACFWVENGEIVAPINVMRFDDSIFNIFGHQLEAITEDRQVFLSTDTYQSRSLRSMHLPGLLVEGINFTL
ncbi:metallopeptidase TldD-related protein [Pseudobacteriovorax antillogorgiicola]|uniref:Predicted Zn-dependent protease or its inactivated homolog n=1 Tax=Pseudobacteriovorax antillogorgiicola TaxID=1513793 RepID=A0A1Y6BKU6_9BACT|nr:metallopeptidase TldD-related protein [Pseudobacteriovorax antillogorgiicola]TCS54688.1 putative Zn-dependent protease [Pseudobacteriovorax antillogorgiicola]SMF16504.1 Predicted Zn-dependent protease or its inactivated homolog [Pseudobacteriovorax antillogorgiicola]